MKLFRLRILIIYALMLITSATASAGAGLKDKGDIVQDTTSFVSPYYEDNQACFKCHGQGTYEYTNEVLGTTS